MTSSLIGNAVANEMFEIIQSDSHSDMFYKKAEDSEEPEVKVEIEADEVEVETEEVEVETEDEDKEVDKEAAIDCIVSNLISISKDMETIGLKKTSEAILLSLNAIAKDTLMLNAEYAAEQDLNNMMDDMSGCSADSDDDMMASDMGVSDMGGDYSSNAKGGDYSSNCAKDEKPTEKPAEKTETKKEDSPKEDKEDKKEDSPKEDTKEDKDVKEIDAALVELDLWMQKFAQDFDEGALNRAEEEIEEDFESNFPGIDAELELVPEEGNPEDGLIPNLKEWGDVNILEKPSRSFSDEEFDFGDEDTLSDTENLGDVDEWLDRALSEEEPLGF
jgi:hypothetical protein